MDHSKFQYLRVHINDIPPEVLKEYGVRPDKFGYVYLEVWRGMYWLKEAGIIAFKQLVCKLAPAGYHPRKQTPGLWTHAAKRTTFTLCVDDLGVKYFSKTDANHLIAVIKEHYDVTIDWSSTRYWLMPLWYREIGRASCCHASVI